MLTSGEAQLARRELSTEEPLTLLLLGRPACFHIYALGVGAPFSIVRLIHVHIL